MAITTLNDSMIQGDTREIEGTATDQNGTVVDIRSTVIEYELAESVSAAPDIRKTVAGGGIVITDGLNGEFTIKIEPSDTLGLSGDYYHECQLTDSQSDVTTLFRGTMTIRDDLID